MIGWVNACLLIDSALSASLNDFWCCDFLCICSSRFCLHKIRLFCQNYMLGCVPKKVNYQLWEKLSTLFSGFLNSETNSIISYKGAAEKVSATVILSLQLLKSYFVQFRLNLNYSVATCSFCQSGFPLSGWKFFYNKSLQVATALTEDRVVSRMFRLSFNTLAIASQASRDEPLRIGGRSGIMNHESYLQNQARIQDFEMGGWIFIIMK